jgi:hypothetical protein
MVNPQAIAQAMIAQRGQELAQALALEMAPQPLLVPTHAPAPAYAPAPAHVPAQEFAQRWLAAEASPVTPEIIRRQAQEMIAQREQELARAQQAREQELEQVQELVQELVQTQAPVRGQDRGKPRAQVLTHRQAQELARRPRAAEAPLLTPKLVEQPEPVGQQVKRQEAQKARGPARLVWARQPRAAGAPPVDLELVADQHAAIEDFEEAPAAQGEVPLLIPKLVEQPEPVGQQVRRQEAQMVAQGGGEEEEQEQPSPTAALERMLEDEEEEEEEEEEEG